MPVSQFDIVVTFLEKKTTEEKQKVMKILVRLNLFNANAVIVVSVFIIIIVTNFSSLIGGNHVTTLKRANYPLESTLGGQQRKLVTHAKAGEIGQKKMLITKWPKLPDWAAYKVSPFEKPKMISFECRFGFYKYELTFTPWYTICLKNRGDFVSNISRYKNNS